MELKIWIAGCCSAKGKYDTAIRIIQGLVKKEPDNKKLVEMLEDLKEKKYKRNLNQKNDYLNY